MEAKIDEDGGVIVTKGIEVSSGGMVVMLTAVGCVCFLLGCLTNAVSRYFSVGGESVEFSRVIRDLGLTGIKHDGHDYVVLWDVKSGEVKGMNHDPKCKCIGDELEYQHRSLEGLKYGMTMVGTYLESLMKVVNGEDGCGKGNGVVREVGSTNVVKVSGVPRFNAGMLVNQKKRTTRGVRCDADGTVNPKGKYRRVELSTSKVVDTGEIGNWKSGQTAPRVRVRKVRGEDGKEGAALTVE